MTDQVDILERWQLGEISGAKARQFARARSYGELYKLAKRFGVEVRVLPRDLVGRTDADAADFLGTTMEGWLALKVGLTWSGEDLES